MRYYDEDPCLTGTNACPYIYRVGVFYFHVDSLGVTDIPMSLAEWVKGKVEEEARERASIKPCEGFDDTGRYVTYPVHERSWMGFR